MYEKFLNKMRKCESLVRPPRGLDVNEFFEVRQMYSKMCIQHTYATTSNKKIAKFFKKWNFYIEEKNGEWRVYKRQ